MTNEYGLDVSYHRKKLELILRDLDIYTPDELARELLRLSDASDPAVVIEPEFQRRRVAQYKLKMDGDSKITAMPEVAK